MANMLKELLNEEQQESISFTLMCAHPHGDSEIIESLILHLGSDLIHTRPLPENIRISTKADLNPFLSYNYELRKKTKTLPYIWPVYIPSTTLDVTIKDYYRVFGNRCTVVDCQHNDKQFYFFDPLPATKYTDTIGKKRNINLAAVAVNDLFIPTEKEPLSGWFNAERYDLLQKERIVPYSKDKKYFCMFYEALIQDANVKDDQKNFLLIHAKNPLEPTKNLEFLAWRYTPNSLICGQQPPQEIGAEVYFIGSLNDSG